MKKLYRSRKDAMVAGVCGGLAEYIGVDSAIVRLVFAVTVVMGGIGVLAYFLAWIIIPEGSNSGEFEYDNSETRHHMELSGDRLRMVVGLGFVGLGVLVLINRFVPWFTFEVFFPAVLIMIGALILMKGKGE